MEPTLHQKPRFLPNARHLLVLLGAVVLPVSALLFGLLPPPGARHSFAAPATPPPPPTYVPTVIPAPPSPPTPTPTTAPATAVPSATPVASASASAVASPAISPTSAPTPTAVVQKVFSLDAVRVSKLNNPGDLAGLTAVRPGSHVWLMIYYTLHSLPHAYSRVATYDILAGSKLLYRVVFRATEKHGTNGRFVKYTIYHLPSTLPFGTYQFRAALAIGHATQTRVWAFKLAAHDHVVYHTGSS
jgi:hypothetical protein